jgi:hypothetical protein
MVQKIQIKLKISMLFYNAKIQNILLLMAHIMEIQQNYDLMDYQNLLDRTIKTFLLNSMTISVVIVDKFV